MNVKQQKINKKRVQFFRPQEFPQQLLHFKPFVITKPEKQKFKNKMNKIDPKVFEILNIKRPDLQDIQIIDDRTLSKDEINEISRKYSKREITIESIHVLKNATSIFDREQIDIPFVSTQILSYLKKPNQKINFQQLMLNEQSISLYDLYPEFSEKAQQDILDKLSVKHPKRGNDMQILKNNYKLNLMNQLDDYIISLMAGVHKTLLIDEIKLKHCFRNMKVKVLRRHYKNGLDVQLPTFSIKGRIHRYLADTGKKLPAINNGKHDEAPDFEITNVRGNVQDPAIVDPLLTVPITWTNQSVENVEANDILAPIYDENCRFGLFSFSPDGSRPGGTNKRKFSLFNQNSEDFHFSPSCASPIQQEQPKRRNPGILTIACTNSKLFEPSPDRSSVINSQNIPQNYTKPDHIPHDLNRPMKYQFSVFDPNSIQMSMPSSSHNFVNNSYCLQPPKHNYPQCIPVLHDFNRTMKYQPPVYDPNDIQISFPSPSQIFVNSYCPQPLNMYPQQNYPQYGEPYQGDGVWVQNHPIGCCNRRKKFGDLDDCVLEDMKQMGVQLNTP